MNHITDGNLYELSKYEAKQYAHDKEHYALLEAYQGVIDSYEEYPNESRGTLGLEALGENETLLNTIFDLVQTGRRENYLKAGALVASIIDNHINGLAKTELEANPEKYYGA